MIDRKPKAAMTKEDEEKLLKFTQMVEREVIGEGSCNGSVSGDTTGHSTIDSFVSNHSFCSVDESHSGYGDNGSFGENGIEEAKSGSSGFNADDWGTQQIAELVAGGDYFK